MKRKKIRGRLASLIAAVLLIALMAVPVCAASDYTAISGTTISFTKYLVVDADTYIPATDFTFDVTAGRAVEPQNAGELQVYAGVKPEKVVVGTAATGVSGKTTFVAGQQTTDGTPTDETDTTKKYASNTVTVDFSKVSFSHPGVYRYIITEKASKNTAFTNDAEPVRTLDVYIQDNNGALEVQGYVMYKGTITTAPKTTATDDVNAVPNGAEATVDVDGVPTPAVKSDKYINEYTTYDLTAGKQVTGNQGSKDKYFKFTIKLKEIGAVKIGANDVFTIDAGYDLEPKKTASTSYSQDQLVQPVDVNADAEGVQVLGSTLKDGLVVYLKHDQYIKVHGIPKGVEYTVTEEKEDYTSTASSDVNQENKVIVTYGTINASNNTSGTLTEDKLVGFKNKKTGVIPTGILMSATPWIIIGVVVVAGIVFFAIRSKKKYEEE